MSKRARQKLKLIYTLEILKRYSDEENPLTANKIAEKLLDYGIEAERKSIYDDIACLEEYGCDIIKSASPKGWFIGDREFEVPEIYLLCDAVRSAKFISAKKSAELIEKLDAMLSVNQVKRRENSVYFGASDKCGNEELYYNIDKIADAIESHRQIELTYSVRYFDSEREVKKTRKTMVINPYALTWQDDYYYLLGNHIKYDNIIHLRLDRISAVKILDKKSRHFSEVSSYTEYFDTADYTNKLFGMYGGAMADVELCCNKRITEQVLDRFSENIFIKKVTDEEFCFTVKAALSEALVTWIINYGSDLKVNSPEELREMVKNRAKTVLRNYE
ncbi:MAG: WYL domain-containing transcriptional regulator [Clostridia bacterium]|nr:WYL domain-containing transcriptional regulator [Clostridia bacterium]